MQNAKNNPMKELVIQFVGKEGTIRLGGLKVLVKILDIKQVYGKNRFLVTPVAGSESVWVETVYLSE